MSESFKFPTNLPFSSDNPSQKISITQIPLTSQVNFLYANKNELNYSLNNSFDLLIKIKIWTLSYSWILRFVQKDFCYLSVRFIILKKKAPKNCFYGADKRSKAPCYCTVFCLQYLDLVLEAKSVVIFKQN